MPFYAWFRAKSRLGQVEKMTITGIEEMNHKKVRVYIDNEFAFVLYKGELRLYGIREGEEIGEEEYLEITGKILPKRAKLRSMNLLKSRAYTEKQLRDKLVQGERYVGLDERFRASEFRFQDRPEALAAVRRRKAIAQKILERVQELHR